MFNNKEREEFLNIIKKREEELELSKKTEEILETRIKSQDELIEKIKSKVCKINEIPLEDLAIDEEISNIQNEVDMMNLSLTTASDSMKGLSVAMTQISAGTQETAANVNEVSATAENASRLAAELVNIAKEGMNVSKKSIQSNKDIQIGYDTLLVIVDFIKDVSAQIKNLSFNASIQAAHAGQSGRGFAIIAEEIKSLSEETSSKVKEIADLVYTMKEVVLEGVTMSEQTEKSFKQVEEIAEQNNNNATETLHAMQEINTAVTQTSNVLSQIANDTEDLKKEVINIEERKQLIDDLVKKLANYMNADDFEFLKAYNIA